MNKFFGMGRLTKDPDVGEKVARYTLAIDRQFKTEGGQDADFINCVVFGKGIDFVSKFLHKGTKILIEARVMTGSYTKDDGTKVYTTDFVVDRHEFCESRKTASGSEEEHHSDVAEPAAFPGVQFVEDDSEEVVPF